MTASMTRTAAFALSLCLAGSAPVMADAGAESDGTTSVMAEQRPTVYRPGTRVRPGRARPPVVRPVRARPARVYAVPAHAPRPRAAIEPLYQPAAFFSIGIQGASVLGADNSRITAGLDTGAGFELGTGWRVSHDLSIDFNAAFTFHDALADGAASGGAMLGNIGVDFRYFLGDWTRALQPYIQVGLGGYFIARDNWNFDTLGGIGFQLGAGLDFYLSRSVSIGAKALYKGAYLDNSAQTWDGFATEAMWLSALSYGGDLKFHF